MNLWNDIVVKLKVPLFMALLMAVGFRFPEFSGLDNSVLGIHPLDMSQIYGIVTVPLVHGNLAHLIGNLSAFLALSALLFVVYEKIAIRVLALLWILTGLFMFLFARSGFYHIGASGVVYALIFFLLAAGVINRTRVPLVITIVVSLFYGGSVWGVFPINNRISWDGHLAGVAAGLSAAIVFSKNIRTMFPQQKPDIQFNEQGEEEDWYGPFDYRNRK